VTPSTFVLPTVVVVVKDESVVVSGMTSEFAGTVPPDLLVRILAAMVSKLDFVTA
jgi:hypothetical protein